MQVRVNQRGIKELLARTDKLDRKTKMMVRDGLRDAAEPIRLSAVRKFSAYDVRTAQNYRTVVRRTGVIRVEQRLGKTTGRRGDFGRLQMRKGLIPAMTEQHAAAMQKVRAVVAKYARRF